MGTLLALVVSGALLGQLASDWEPTKWIFVTNLPLAQFYSGVPPPVAGMTLTHSVVVLAVWGSAPSPWAWPSSAAATSPPEAGLKRLRARSGCVAHCRRDPNRAGRELT